MLFSSPSSVVVRLHADRALCFQHLLSAYLLADGCKRRHFARVDTLQQAGCRGASMLAAFWWLSVSAGGGRARADG